MNLTPLKKVELQTDVYMVCLQHALSTESFEVMGLLIGNCENGITRISAVTILKRSDKKKDRVEISPELLTKAVAETDRLTELFHRPMRVLGWYHSHPHITVMPSRVDLRTQATYQTMDPCFVGLIFSVFSELKDSKEQEISLISFQSCDNDATVLEIPLEIVHAPKISDECLRTMTEVPKILVQEEEETAEACKDHPDLLARIYNNATRTRALINITDIALKPLIQTFDKRISLNRLRAAYLREELEELRRVCNG